MIWPVGRGLLAAWLADYVVEFALYGILVGVIYKPAAVPARRAVVT